MDFASETHSREASFRFNKDYERGLNKPFVEIDSREKNRLKKLFAAPESFNKEPSDNQERVYLIVGESGWGRTIAAVNFALRIAEYAHPHTHDNDGIGNAAILTPIYRYQSHGDPLHDLNSIVQHPAFPAKSICIVQDAFAKGLPPQSLTIESAEEYRKELAKSQKNAYLILTTTPEALTNTISGFKRIEIDDVPLNTVIDKHLNVIFQADIADKTTLEDPAIQAILKYRRIIAEAKPTPKQIGLMFDEFRNKEPKNETDVDLVVRRIMQSNSKDLRGWFRNISSNTKVFALLNAILIENNYEPNTTDIVDLYDAFVQRARRKLGTDGADRFIDPRNGGIDDLIDDAGMTQTANALHFKPFIREHILQVEVPNYQGLLWLLVELLIEHLDIKPVAKSDTDLSEQLLGNPEQQRLTFDQAEELLATLVGHVGMFRPRKLRELIDRLVSHPQYRFKVLTGTLLKPHARNKERHQDIRNLLESWLALSLKTDASLDEDGGDLGQEIPPRFLAAAETIRAVYGLLQKEGDDETRNAVQSFVQHMGKIGGSFEQYIRVIEGAYTQSIIAEIEQARGDKAFNDKEINARYEQMNLFIAQHIFDLTEQNIIVLMLLISSIATTHPENAIELIKNWLEENQNKNAQEIDEEDAEVDRILTLDAVLLQEHIDEEQRTRQRKSSLTTLKSMAWHIGMIAATMLFQETQFDLMGQVKLARISPQGPDKKPETQETGEEDTENAGKEDVLDSSTDTGVTQEDIAEDAAPTPEPIDVEAKQGDTPENLNKSEDSYTKVNKLKKQILMNRIAVRQRGFPLLKLLRPLMESSTIVFTVNSFLKNMTRGDKVLRYHRQSPFRFNYDIPVDQLRANPLQEAFRAILNWYEVMIGDRNNPDLTGEKEWVEHVYPMLLDLFNYATQPQARALREILFASWIESPHQRIRQIAHALLARASILDGQILDLPSNRHGVILLDAGMRNYDWNAYYANVYRAIQQLATISPLRVYALGSQKLLKFLGESRDTSIHLISRELRPRHTRSRLLSPLLEAQVGGEPLINPKDTHFVLVFTPVERLLADRDRGLYPDILDLLDVLEEAIGTTAQIDPKLMHILSSGMYTDEEKAKARAEIAGQNQKTQWEWKNKIFLLTPEKYTLKQEFQQVMAELRIGGQSRNLLTDVEEFISLIGVSSRTFTGDADRIQNALVWQVSANLHHLPPEQWVADLIKFWSGREKEFEISAELSFDNVLTVHTQLDQWLMKLGDVSHADHPRDVSMMILWTVLTLSRQDLPGTVNFVKRWLDSPDTDLTQIMGLSCVKTLFNFYRFAPNLYTNAELYRPLLDLLPALTGTERGKKSDEFWGIFSALMLWSRHEGWLTLLCDTENGNPLFDAVRKIAKGDNLADLRLLIGLHESALEIAQLYARLQLDWPAFEKLTHEFAIWRRETPRAERQVELQKFHRNLNNPTIKLSDLNRTDQVFDQLDQSLGESYTQPQAYKSVMAQLRQSIESTTQYTESELQNVIYRVKETANAIRLQTLNRIDERMPSLTPGKRYGVILTTGTTSNRGRDLRRKVRGFVQQFREHISANPDCGEFVLTVHRIGSNELLYTNTAAGPLPTTKLLMQPDHIPPRPPIITAILERYRNISEVAFILIVTNEMPHDLVDWRDQPEWTEKMFLHAPGERAWISEFYAGITSSKRHRQFKEEVEFLSKSVFEYLGC